MTLQIFLQRYSLKWRLLLALSLAAMTVTFAFWLINSRYFLENAGVLATSLTLDLTIVLPAVYFLLIKNTPVPKLSVIPVFVLCLIAASQIIPAEQHRALDTIKYLLTPLELLTAGIIIYKTRQVIREQKSSDLAKTDFTESLREVLLKQLKNQTASNILATEISIFFYAISGWKKPAVEEGITTFTYHKRCGYLMIVGVFFFLIIFETAALHFFLSKYSLTAAWIFTGLSLYGMVFLAGDSNAVKQRPIYSDGEFLYLRIGIRWFSKIPRSEISSIELIKKEPVSEDNANLVLIGSPNVLVRFKSVQRARGYYGIARTFNSASFSFDEPERFKEMIEPA